MEAKIKMTYLLNRGFSSSLVPQNKSPVASNRGQDRVIGRIKHHIFHNCRVTFKPELALKAWRAWFGIFEVILKALLYPVEFLVALTLSITLLFLFNKASRIDIVGDIPNENILISA